MRVDHLSLAHFRNYETAEVSFSAGPQVLIGRNGQGKTNLIEAIAYFDSLSSHRVSSDQPLLQAGSDTAVARMKVSIGERTAQLELQFERGRPKRAQLQGQKVKPSELMRWFTAVVFAPEDLMIVRGDPAQRRRFLDAAIVTRFPSLAGVFRDYEKVLKQRTALLKSLRQGVSRSAVEATLDVWDEQLIAFGSRIMMERRAFVKALQPYLADAYFALVDTDQGARLSLDESVFQTVFDAEDVSRETSGDDADRNVSRETLEQGFRESLQHHRDAECQRGVSLVGPHRDDLVLELNGLPVKGYASHGESWSFALAVKTAFAELLRKESPLGDPVLILDDVFAELDRRRRDRLMSSIADFEQIIVTAAVEEDVPEGVEWNRQFVRAGVVSRERMTE